MEEIWKTKTTTFAERNAVMMMKQEMMIKQERPDTSNVDNLNRQQEAAAVMETTTDATVCDMDGREEENGETILNRQQEAAAVMETTTDATVCDMDGREEENGETILNRQQEAAAVINGKPH
ncbi:uncharacterized protein LOC135219263 [Macrobrachium nipponense]|uniref:uncharacterized protein LOC135219263 n=1 Tax=Macrobrachium nipponense TaxID=159736 RepID=UPI0030C8C27B